MSDTTEKTFLEHLDHVAHGIRPAADSLVFHGKDEAIGALFDAYSAATAEFGDVVKGIDGQVGNQKFKYADLAVVMHALRGPLAKHGLSLLQPMATSPLGPEYCRISTILAKGAARITSHLDYAWADMTSPDAKESIKDQGKVVTYLRRYAIQSLFVIQGDRDADSEPTRTRAPTPPRRPAPNNNDELNAIKRRILAIADERGVKRAEISEWISKTTGIDFGEVRSDLGQASIALERLEGAA